MRVPDLQAKKQRGAKIAMLTAYSTWMARLLADVADILLVGDSLGMVELGYDTTIPVTMSDMVRHTRAVRNGAPEALVIADMPFLSHQISAGQALRNAGRLVQQGGATGVKIEGGGETVSVVAKIVAAGIPVMGHLGLRPQSVHQQGGFRRQATKPHEQEQLLEDAAALEGAGAFAVVLESIPPDLAERVTRSLGIPTIGIGAGPECDGQVLVTHDILGLSGRTAPPFARRYAEIGTLISAAVTEFAEDVHSGRFPAPAKVEIA